MQSQSVVDMLFCLSSALIAGGAAGGALFVLLLLTVYCCCLRKKYVQKDLFYLTQTFQIIHTIFQTNFIVMQLAMFYLLLRFDHHRRPSSGTECSVVTAR